MTAIYNKAFNFNGMMIENWDFAEQKADLQNHVNYRKQPNNFEALNFICMR